MSITIENIFTLNTAWIHVYTTATQSTSFASADTPTSLIRATNLTTETSRNLSADEDGLITIENSGIYMTNLSCSFSGATNDNMTIYIYVNGISQNVGKTSWTQKGGNKWEISTTGLLNLKTDDIIDIRIENNSDTTSINLLNFNHNVIKLY